MNEEERYQMFMENVHSMNQIAAAMKTAAKIIVEALAPSLRAFFEALPAEEQKRLLKKARHEARYRRMMKRGKP